MAESGVPPGTRKGMKTRSATPTTPSPKQGSRTIRAKANAPLKPKATPKESIGSPKLTQLVYGKLLRAIVQGRLDLGEPLSENDLARALNLSKAPIRESLSELRLRGLVEVVPRSGSYVFSPTVEQISELCDYRALLETNALRISLGREPKNLTTALRRIVARMKEAHREDDTVAGNELDKEYHMSIIQLSNNRYLTESYEHIGLTIEALRYRIMSTSLYRSKVQEEHAQIAELVAKNQLARASRLLESHIQRANRVHSRALGNSGRLKRKDYHFRDYAEILS